MTRLSDTQLVILGAAAQRADLAVLPLPDTLKLKGGALTNVMDSLRNRGLIRVVGAEGGPQRVVITSEGMAAIGVEPEGDEAPAGADTAPTSADGHSAADAPAPASEADGAEKRAKTKPTKGKGKKAARTAPAGNEPEAAAGQPAAKPAPRAGTKQALMIDMLKRPEGATVEQIAEATGWQHHTIATIAAPTAMAVSARSTIVGAYSASWGTSSASSAAKPAAELGWLSRSSRRRQRRER
jgi:hypothetical protein